jgi:hypothetical protein
MVRTASDPYYVDGSLLVRVPPSLGRPLDGRDVDEVLYRAGDLELTVHCDGPRYVAETVRAMPRAG